MISTHQKIGIIVPDWDALCRDDAAYRHFLRAVSALDSMIVYAVKPTDAATTLLRDRFPRAFLASARILSLPRLARLCAALYAFDGQNLVPYAITLPPLPQESRIGFMVANGYGLGHVTRMKAIASGLAPFAPQSFMSFSAGLVDNAFYLPSQQYLQLQGREAVSYTRQSIMRYFESADPTHIIYDGNVLPDGLLAALAARPHIHLTWVRRGMWQKNTHSRHMAQQALADLVIEPGDIAQSYDDGPSWKKRGDFTPPLSFLKTLPVRPVNDNALPLKLDPGRRHALIMTGAARKADTSLLQDIVDQVRACQLVPVIAHWPMAQEKPVYIDGAHTVERAPLAPHYAHFDVIISAAGYNSFHELLAGGHPVIFMPQEDEGRDNQLARARWAADLGLAQMCRRHDRAALATMIPLARRAENTMDWFDDWQTLADAMGLQKPATERKPRFTRIKPSTLKAMHRRARKKTYPNEFFLALDMTTRAFLKMGIRREAIIVTNSIDPVALRRENYRYLWLNDQYLTPSGLKRQFLNWLDIWRPEKISG